MVLRRVAQYHCPRRDTAVVKKQITMTKGWSLLLLLIISCQNVDSQSTDEAVCDGEDEKVCHEKQFFVMQKDTLLLQTEITDVKSDIQTLMDNQQRLLQLLNETNATKPRDCADILNSGESSDGVYTVHIGRRQQRRVQVYCDMITDGGGWTVFQRRQDGSVDFWRNWTDYATGFGNLTGEFWLGNDNLRLMTLMTRQVLRVDLADFEGNTSYAEHDDFIVGCAITKYKLISLGEYRGTAGASLSYHLGQRFSTRDQDNDALMGNSCAATLKGGWWYNECHRAHLNGLYYSSENYTSSYSDGVLWPTWKSWWSSMRFTEMKLRPYDV